MRKGVSTLLCLLLVSIMLSGCVERWTGMDGEEPGTQNVYRATDSDATTTDGANDTLFSIRWNEAYDDLYWGYVAMKLEVGDTVYDCTITDGGDCFISQDGDDDTIWQTNEFLTIMENDLNIIGGSGGIVNLYISYRGTQIAGSDSLYLQ